jgi:hypothetical protein
MRIALWVSLSFVIVGAVMLFIVAPALNLY